jgi:RNA polymerase sigma-70 factor (ECF subfamily)
LEFYVISSQKEGRFEAMVLPHLDSAFNLARWLARNDQDAEDIVQEAYLRAFKFFDGFHGDNGRPWLLGIVRNTFHTWYEQNKAQRQGTEFDEQLHGTDSVENSSSAFADGNPETVLMRKDARCQVNKALKELSTEFREVLILRDLEDLSYKEIAAIVGIPIGTVMSRLARGRKQLAQTLA